MCNFDINFKPLGICRYKRKIRSSLKDIHHQYKDHVHFKTLGNGDLIARKIIYSVLALSAL